MLKLTGPYQGDVYVVAPSHISFMTNATAVSDGGTYISDVGGRSFTVKETIDEIMAMLDAWPTDGCPHAGR